MTRAFYPDMTCDEFDNSDYPGADWLPIGTYILYSVGGISFILPDYQLIDVNKRDLPDWIKTYLLIL